MNETLDLVLRMKKKKKEQKTLGPPFFGSRACFPAAEIPGQVPRAPAPHCLPFLPGLLPQQGDRAWVQPLLHLLSKNLFLGKTLQTHSLSKETAVTAEKLKENLHLTGSRLQLCDQGHQC